MQLYVQFKLGSNITFIKLKENARIETCDAFMLLRIYFCDGCFIQMLKDLKNLLKLSLKILFIKRKRKISFHSSLPQIRPAGFSFFSAGPAPFRGPAPQPAAQLTFPPPLGPATRSAQPSSRALRVGLATAAVPSSFP